MRNYLRTLLTAALLMLGCTPSEPMRQNWGFS